MAEVRMRTFEELYKDLLAIYELADEALQYRVPKSVEYNLEGIQRIAWDWVEWIEKLEKHLAEQKERGGGE